MRRAAKGRENLLFTRDGKFNNLDVLNEADVDSSLLRLFTKEKERVGNDASVDMKAFRKPNYEEKGETKTHAVGLQDSENSLLGDKVRKLDVSLLIVLILLLLFIILII